jgi:2-phospho-L-lactate guanylyltransferase
MRWSVVLPVKRLALAKTRLRASLPLPAGTAERIVLAMALDTAAAALACPAVAAVVVVTDDPAAAEALEAAGAVCVPDGQGGLNAAVAHGSAYARAAGWAPGVAVLGADLPALTSAELAGALAQCPARGTAFAADAAGTGTVLLAAGGASPLRPRFGPGSAVAHARSGARALTGDWPGLRRDVDTAADLSAAAALGLGAHTTALLAAGSWAPRPA